MIKLSMMLCATLSLSSCATKPPMVLDSFCKLYEPVIQEKGDAASLTAARLSVKKRILGNDKLAKTC